MMVRDWDQKFLKDEPGQKPNGNYCMIPDQLIKACFLVILLF